MSSRAVTTLIIGTALLSTMGCWANHRPANSNALIVARTDYQDEPIPPYQCMARCPNSVTCEPCSPGKCVNPGGYDYAPSVMLDDDGLYKMWWCGDQYIHYAEATNLSGPWSARPSTPFFPQNCDQVAGETFDGNSQVVLCPTRQPGTFDRDDVCDPSVIKVNGAYYMYYGGNNYDNNIGCQTSPNWNDYDVLHSPFFQTTTMGVATSADGINWSRQPGPIIRPALNQGCSAQSLSSCPYGAGQPSVFFDLAGDQRFYMLYMQALAAGGGANDQLYVVRAADAAFSTQTEVWTGAGWQAYTPPFPIPQGSQHPEWSVADYMASIDWQYADVLGQIVRSDYDLAQSSRMTIRLLAGGPLSTFLTYDFPTSDFHQEGAGIVHLPNGHAIKTAGSTLTKFDLVRAVCNDGSADCSDSDVHKKKWDLAWVGINYAMDSNVAAGVPTLFYQILH